MNWEGFRVWARDALERLLNTFWQCFMATVVALWAQQSGGDETAMVGASSIDWALCLDIALLGTILSLAKSGAAPLFNSPTSASLIDLSLRRAVAAEVPPVIPTPDSE
jgi:hypothetical protein